MEKVRLMLWDAREHCAGEVTFTGATLLDAVTDAVVTGMASNMDFSVTEAKDDGLHLYWSGRRAQKLPRAEVRHELEKKGVGR